MKQLPIHLDLFAVFIFLGAMQSYFLSYFFLTGKQRKVLSNRVLGIVLFVTGCLLAEVFAGYSNYMGRYPWLVDFSEPFNYAIGPLTYLYIYTKIYPRFERYQWLHFVPFAFYFVYLAVFWHTQSLAFKYNGFITAFYPNDPELFAKAAAGLPEDPLYIKQYINQFTGIHFLVYSLLGVYTVRQAFQKAQLSFWSKSDASLVWVRKFILQFAFAVLLFFIIKLSFKNDLGDHLLAVYLALMIYLVSMGVIRQSVFFEEKTEVGAMVEKYQKSSLSSEKEEQTLNKLRQLMSEEKPFLESTLSLPVLAKKLAISTHHLSQIINENLKQNFFEMMATYRIEEAQRILINEAQQHLKIEEIAEMVGYNSKSAFNSAFKKITQQTPSQYRKSTIGRNKT